MSSFHRRIIINKYIFSNNLYNLWHKLSFSVIALPFLVNFPPLVTFHLWHSFSGIEFAWNALGDMWQCLMFDTLHTAQKMKYSMKDFLVNVIKSSGNYGFGHIYWRNHWKKSSFFVQWYKKKPYFLFSLFGEITWWNGDHVWTEGIWFGRILHDQNKYNHCPSPFMLFSFDLAKDCGYLFYDICELSWHECVPDQQYTEVTWSNDQIETSCWFFLEKNKVGF